MAASSSEAAAASASASARLAPRSVLSDSRANRVVDPGSLVTLDLTSLASRAGLERVSQDKYPWIPMLCVPMFDGGNAPVAVVVQRGWGTNPRLVRLDWVFQDIDMPAEAARARVQKMADEWDENVDKLQLGRVRRWLKRAQGRLRPRYWLSRAAACCPNAFYDLFRYSKSGTVRDVQGVVLQFADKELETLAGVHFTENHGAGLRWDGTPVAAAGVWPDDDARVPAALMRRSGIDGRHLLFVRTWDHRMSVEESHDVPQGDMFRVMPSVYEASAPTDLHSALASLDTDAVRGKYRRWRLWAEEQLGIELPKYEMFQRGVKVVVSSFDEIHVLHEQGKRAAAFSSAAVGAWRGLQTPEHAAALREAELDGNNE